jgi:hypothetical protein
VAYRFYINHLDLNTSPVTNIWNIAVSIILVIAIMALFFTNAFIFDFAVRGLIRFHGCIGNLYQCRFEVDTNTCNSDRFFLTSRSLFPSARSAQQHKRLELVNWDISVPISEMIVIADALSSPGMV